MKNPSDDLDHLDGAIPNRRGPNRNLRKVLYSTPTGTDDGFSVGRLGENLLVAFIGLVVGAFLGWVMRGGTP